MASQRVKISIECSGIKNSRLLQKPNPICVLNKLDAKTGAPQQVLGRSDCIKQDVNPR